MFRLLWFFHSTFRGSGWAAPALGSRLALGAATSNFFFARTSTPATLETFAPGILVERVPESSTPELRSPLFEIHRHLACVSLSCYHKRLTKSHPERRHPMDQQFFDQLRQSLEKDGAPAAIDRLCAG